MGSVGRLVVVSGEAAVKATRNRATKDVLQLSKNAISRLKELKATSDKPVNRFRLGVKESSGCVGAEYDLVYDDDNLSTKYDEVVTDPESGISVVIDPKALFYVIGTTMDYQSTLEEEQFVFYNPNATAVCGCGSSFTVDPRYKE